MNRIIEQTKDTIPSGYQLVFSEAIQLMRHATAGGGDDALDAIVEAFTYGFALGTRYQKNKKPRQKTGRA